MDKQTMLKAAIEYAERGIAVFPLAYKDKIPTTKGGVKDATTDLAQINEWWLNAPFANIGIAMGEKSGGLIAIDIDMDVEKGKDGFDSLHEYERDHGALPETITTITGRGGSHMIYKTSAKIGNRTNVLNGIDIRGEGGYLVAPPSIHPSGAFYEWEYSFDDCDIADADANVINLCWLGTKKDSDADPREKFELPSIIENGNRNDVLFRYASQLQAKGYDDNHIMQLVLLANENNCAEPYEGKELTELKKSIKSALKFEKGKKSSDVKPPAKLEAVSGLDLQRMKLDKPQFLVDEILPLGVCILGAPPKTGKSWLVLDLGLSVALGRPFLGYKTDKGEVLYLALEDSFYRLKERAMKVLDGDAMPSNIYFSIQAPTIDMTMQNDGLIGAIIDHLQSHPDTKLIIIDTLQMVKGKQEKNMDAYEYTYKLLNALRPLYQNGNLGIVLVHHTRKASINDDNPFETFLGSQALAGATDGMYILRKKIKEEVGTLIGRGRDFEDFELAIKRSESSCRWVNLGDFDDIEEIKAREEYNQHPITITIKQKLQEIIESDEPVKEYVVSAKDFQMEVLNYTGEWIGNNEKAFMGEVKRFDGYLYKDGIQHILPNGSTTYRGKKGLFHRFKLK